VKTTWLILKYLILPLVVFGVVVHFLLEDIRFFGGAVILVAILFVVAVIRSRFQLRRDTVRGWRVGHRGRDTMYYEELHDGTWKRMEIGGEMLTGRAHHVIYFGSTPFPDWAQARRDEIIQRVKSEFRTPDYEYDDS
jgi:hypothetical protein